MFYTYYIKAENKYYFGSRTPEFMLNQDAKDDFMIKYFSSTTDERLQEIIRKGEYEKAEIIKEYTDRQECLKDEEYLIKNFWWLYGTENCWNHYADGKFSTAGSKMSEEAKEKRKETWDNKTPEEINEFKRVQSEKHKGQIPWNIGKENSKETREKISISLKNKTPEEIAEIVEKRNQTNANKSEEEQQAIIEKRKETMANKTPEEITEIKERWYTTINNRSEEEKAITRKKKHDAWYNRSEEEQQAIIEKCRDASLGEKNPAFGRKWMNNGIEQIYPKVEEQEYYLSLGYKFGQLMFKWQTPTGEVKIKTKTKTIKRHPDWICLGTVES